MIESDYDMDYEFSYKTRTKKGALWFMVVENTIVALHNDGSVVIHDAIAHGPTDKWGHSFSLSDLFGFGEELWPRVLVGRIRHATETRIGFYLAHWHDWYGWGYIWNVDHPERSGWERAEIVAAAISTEDLPQSGNLARISEDIPLIASLVHRINPRAAALATVTAGEPPEDVAANIPKLRRWLHEYETALREWSVRRDGLCLQTFRG